MKITVIIHSKKKREQLEEYNVEGHIVIGDREIPFDAALTNGRSECDIQFDDMSLPDEMTDEQMEKVWKLIEDSVKESPYPFAGNTIEIGVGNERYGHEIEIGGNANATCLKGYVQRNISFEGLKELFGEGEYGGGGKVQHEWVIQIDGVLCTIYDWKISGDVESNTSWNIGGHKAEAADKVNEVVLEYLKEKGKA